MLDYTPFFQMLEERGLNQYKILKMNMINNSLLDKLKHNQNINLLTLEQLCKNFDCKMTDIVRFTEENQKNNP